MRSAQELLARAALRDRAEGVLQSQGAAGRKVGAFRERCVEKAGRVRSAQEPVARAACRQRAGDVLQSKGAADSFS